MTAAVKSGARTPPLSKPKKSVTFAEEENAGVRQGGGIDAGASPTAVCSPKVCSPRHSPTAVDELVLIPAHSLAA